MPKAAKTSDDETPRETTKAAPPGKKTKGPTAYQSYMKNQLPIYKKEHPEALHKEAFAAVAKQWSSADENPNKGKEKPTKKKAEAKPKPGAENKEDVADDE